METRPCTQPAFWRRIFEALKQTAALRDVPSTLRERLLRLDNRLLVCSRHLSKAHLISPGHIHHAGSLPELKRLAVVRAGIEERVRDLKTGGIVIGIEIVSAVDNPISEEVDAVSFHDHLPRRLIFDITPRASGRKFDVALSDRPRAWTIQRLSASR